MAGSILITGAGGLIGTALVDYVLRHRSQCAVFAAGRDEQAMAARFGSNVCCVHFDALEDVKFKFAADIIVHAASPASPELFVANPVETMLANINGVKGLMEYARRVGTSKFLFVSSSEVYGRMPPRENGFREDDYGFVDLLDVRSSYPMGKRAAETLCVSYAKEYGIDVSIVRPGHIYGPTANRRDGRVSSVFAWKAALGEPIVMKSEGTSLRSYTHCDDCARAIMTVAEKGLSGEAYNIANRNGICSIRHMAEIMADEGGVQLQFECAPKNDAVAFNPMDNSCLDPTKLESLGWKGEIGCEEGFRRTVRALRTMMNQDNIERK